MVGPAVGECYLPALLSVTYDCLPGELAFLGETRTNGIWETSFVSDSISNSDKANRTCGVVNPSSHVELNLDS